jgi:hypothetical protein
MNYDTTSVFESSTYEKGRHEWNTFHKVTHDRVTGFHPITPRSTNEPRYTNILHINRYRTA